MQRRKRRPPANGRGLELQAELGITCLPNRPGCSRLSHLGVFSPINLNVFIGYSIILWGAEEVRFYDGIKKQKLEVCFNVLALTFSKVILNCAFACACV